ncbi:MAG TPA: winged helix-turn-helix domain-containing protein [Sphingomicrobium sp.]|nr:winged helix-turn-helix domain-containing protein [Sphingomicrobium sp.]
MDRPVSFRGSRVDLAQVGPFDLGQARIDPAAHDAVVAGRREHLQPQTMKVLVALHQRLGEVVGRDELVDRCWDGRIIGDDVINRCISLLRRFADRVGGFAIQTVHKSGYRLVEARGASLGRRRKATTVGMIAIAGIAAAAFGLWPGPVPEKPPVPTIAILPIAADPVNPGATALANETTASLVHLLAESGFAPTRIAALPASGPARPDLLVSGSARRSGDGAEVTVRLEDTRSGVTILSRRLSASGKETAALPDRIAVRVAATLNWTGSLMILDRRSPAPPRVRAELLRLVGISVEGGGPLRAFDISRRIASQEPDSAMAQLSLAYNAAFALDSMPRAKRDEALALGRAADERARRLAPAFGDVSVPWCLLHSTVRLAECETRMRRGLRADPDASFVAFYLSNLLHGVGRTDEALKMARAAIADDPYKPAKLAALVRLLESIGDTDEAETVYARAVYYWPDYQELVWSRITGILQRGDFRALARFHRARPGPMTRQRRFAIAVADAVVGGDAAKVRGLCGDSERPDNARIICMVALPQIGDVDAGFAEAERQYVNRRGATRSEEDHLFLDDPTVPPNLLLTAPSAAPLRRHPGFLPLAGRLGLTDYWRSVALPDFCSERPEPMCRRLR